MELKTDKSNLRILFATPHYDTYCTNTYAYSLYKTKWPVGSQVQLVSCMGCATGKALDNFAKAAIEGEYDRMVIGCDDAGWKPDDVCKLIDDDKDVVSGFSRERFHPFRIKAFTSIDRENVMFSFRQSIGEGLERVYSVAGELQVYKVPIFKRLKYPWFQGVLRPNGEPTTDDFNFGCRCYDAGVEIYVDWRVDCRHIAAGMETDKNGLRAT